MHFTFELAHYFHKDGYFVNFEDESSACLLEILGILLFYRETISATYFFWIEIRKKK